MQTPERVGELAERVLPRALELRRELHQNPEPSYHEYETTRLIKEALVAAGLDPVGRTPRTGLWVDSGPDPVCAFRADIDALPIDEPAGNIPESNNPGWMHACGHDAHSAIAFGIAVVMSQLDKAPGVRFLFQPAEEGFPGGAVELVGEGLIDGLSSILAFHVDPAIEAGRFGIRTGSITASADKFTIGLTGPGGHTARPHQTVDLVDAAARIVVDLPAVLRSSVDARRALIVVFGSIHGGTTENVIPTRVELKGTARTLDREVWDQLPALIEKTLSKLVGVTEATYELTYQRAIPPVVNDARVMARVADGINSVYGDDAIVHTRTSMGGEDFANYLDVVPGALVRLGAAKGHGDLHSAGFQLDEAAIAHGIRGGVAALLNLGSA
ncbi:MAG: amidohydrolase [Acidimicrobiia bacterium]